MKFLARLTVVLAIFVSVGAVAAQRPDRDRGIDLYREGKYVEAIDVLEKTVAANEKDRAAWLYLGGAYVHAGDETKARNAFEKSNAKPTVPQPKYERSVKLTNRPRPKYTEKARGNRASGTVRIAIELRADGTVGFVFPLQTIKQDLIQPSLDAAKGTQFEPAMKDGKPVTVITMFQYGYWIG